MDIPIKKIIDTLRLLVTFPKIRTRKAEEIVEIASSLSFPWIKGYDFKVASHKYVVRIIKKLSHFLRTAVGFREATIKA